VLVNAIVAPLTLPGPGLDMPIENTNVPDTCWLPSTDCEDVTYLCSFLTHPHRCCTAYASGTTSVVERIPIIKMLRIDFLDNCMTTHQVLRLSCVLLQLVQILSLELQIGFFGNPAASLESLLRHVFNIMRVLWLRLKGGHIGWGGWLRLESVLFCELLPILVFQPAVGFS